MVSALVSVGLGQLSVGDLQEILDSRENTNPKARRTAPPDGLFLREVLYNEKGKVYKIWNQLMKINYPLQPSNNLIQPGKRLFASKKLWGKVTRYLNLLKQNLNLQVDMPMLYQLSYLALC